ncbi:MAG: hypothetical protein C4533_01805 [Candidatus Omnitrophota bacterium]|jgi:nitrite reductase (NADH) large subunit|nr:MAG: hypothetical protein C4533_01805 [Candidatus Omnitrophota bacterium]
MKKIIIVGCSVSGHTAAVNLKNKSDKFEVSIITEENYPFYDRRKLTELISGNINEEKELFVCEEEFYRKSNINFLKDSAVVSANISKKQLSLKDKQASLNFDYLVVASGQKPVVPEIPGSRKTGVFSFYSLQDAKDITAYFIDEQICLVGLNDVSLHLSEALAAKYQTGVKIISEVAPSQAQALPVGVEVIQSKPQEIIGEGQVQAVKLYSGKIIAASAVIFTDSRQANVGFLKNCGIETIDSRLAVDDLMRTSNKDIFACGSVASRRDAFQAEKTWEDCLNDGINLAENLIKITGD